MLEALKRVLLVSFAMGFAAGASIAAAEEGDTFQLKDGDRVVFLGDSLTASRGYTDLVELYTRFAYPKRDIEFFNAGVGGDTAQGALKRLEKDVLSHKPTLVTVCFGINDIGWGGLATPERIQAHTDGMRQIIERCKKAGARVVMLGPCVTRLGDQAYDPETDVLHKMSATDRKTADEMGEQSIALYDQFRAIQLKIREEGKAKEVQTHAGDGIHLDPVGNLIFAHILLKGLGAPDQVASLEIDASGAAPTARGWRSQAEDLKKTEKGITFIRKDEGWPLVLGDISFGLVSFLPTHETLSKYELKVTGLDASEWFLIRVNGQDLSTVTLTQLREGVNLTPAAPPVFGPTAPWTFQSSAGKQLAEARTKLAGAFWTGGAVIPKESKLMRPFQSKIDKQMKEVGKSLQALSPTKPLLFEVVATEKPQPEPDRAAIRRYLERLKQEKARQGKKK